MKRRSQFMAFLLLVVFISISLQGKDPVVQSLWTDTPIKLDAVADDWASVSMNKNKSTKVNYAFKNDGNFLYVYFTFTDMKYVSSLRQTGMSVWINVDGRKKRKFGLKLSKITLTADAWIAQLEKAQGDSWHDNVAPAFQCQQAGFPEADIHHTAPPL